MLQYVILFDTSVTTDNLGDEIITESIREQIEILYPYGFLVRIPTHDTIGRYAHRVIKKSHISFVGGTNLLCAHWFPSRQWKIGFADFWRIGCPVLFGVGWQQYQRNTDPLTAVILRHLLKNSFKHSVRDSYTVKRLKDVGVTNIINTGCPTMWGLTEEHCARLPTTRAENALITVTAWRAEPQIDRLWIELVMRKYKEVYFWPQMFDDFAYAKAIGGDRLVFIEPTLAAYNNALAKHDIDFIGTRLHGGIRALQRGRRAMIIQVDNRATEISRDTNLPTIKRDDLNALAKWIDQPSEINIKMPWDAISAWKSQFSNRVAL